MKPFDRQHPIRAFFGDPRTVFRAADDADLGAFSFHNGVDIVAADGTPVYPVLSGIVSLVKPDEIVVTTHAGLRLRVFQYWHLVSMVRLHQQVQAQRTVLGTVQPGRGHVHLTEIDGPVVENPLQPGHLTPYRDDTPPTVEELYFRDPYGAHAQPRGAHRLGRDHRRRCRHAAAAAARPLDRRPSDARPRQLAAAHTQRT